VFARRSTGQFPEIDHVELFGPPNDAKANSRNFVLCPGKAYDRSPCGTGTSANSLASLRMQIARREAVGAGEHRRKHLHRFLHATRRGDNSQDYRSAFVNSEATCCSTNAIHFVGGWVSTAKHVVVIGAGVIGVCSAFYLARRGYKVTVVDRDEPAHEGCSFGNAGMVVPSHFVPLAAPGMVALGLKWMWNPESPFWVKPRLSPELLGWVGSSGGPRTRARLRKQRRFFVICTWRVVPLSRSFPPGVISGS
jgi:hypothetical protein